MPPHRSLAAIIAALVTCTPAFAQSTPQPRNPELLPSGYDPADDVFYQFMPIAWRHGESSTQLPDIAKHNRFGNFAGMTDSIPYLKSLGVTGVWMTPIFPSPAYHGYQHGPADRINPWFGEEAEFWTFVRRAKDAGIRVYIDFVVYGINEDSPQYMEARESPQGDKLALFAFENAGRTKPFGYSFRTWTGDTVRFVHWDLRNQSARQQVIEWGRRWLDPNADGDPSDGVAGYRLDHVWSTYKPDGKAAPDGWGYNIEPFWMEWKRELQKVNPAVLTFAEQARWETWGLDLLPAHDAAFTKPFEFAARRALREEQAEPLYKAMDAVSREVPPGRTLLAIIGDHDVDRLVSDIGADKAEHAGRARAAAAVLLLQPFPPVIYYGDEVGMLGRAGRYGSDSNDIPRREPMKWRAADGPPMTRYHALDPRTVSNQYSRDHDGRSVEEQTGVAGSLLETYRELIRLRRDHVSLRRGTYEPVPCSHAAVWRFKRVHADETADVAINLSGKALAPSPELPGGVAAYGYSLQFVPTLGR